MSQSIIPKGVTVFLGCPTHDNRLDSGAAAAIWGCASKARNVIAMCNGCSLLTLNCNGLWCNALSYMDQGLEWFAMLHSDIQPEANWIDVLIAEAEKYGADIMSAVVPIKSEGGLTSTAIDDPDDPWTQYTRITLKQLWHEKFPETFDAKMASAALAGLPDELAVKDAPASRLLANTGCFVARLNRPWNTKTFFQNHDTVMKCADGQYHAFAQPEDWVFSRNAAINGAKVMATRKLALTHRGISGYPSNGRWGANRDEAGEKDRELKYGKPELLRVA